MSNSKQQAPKARNRDFAIATITVHAAAARPRPLKTAYNRKDKSWKKNI